MEQHAGYYDKLISDILNHRCEIHNRECEKDGTYGRKTDLIEGKFPIRKRYIRAGESFPDDEDWIEISENEG
ncbi:MAG: hypothetical protein K2Q14_05480 [Gammaproteobacteria bacterium]|nr:hypothetical protein [Gammaproteobacteria bacterium]